MFWTRFLFLMELVVEQVSSRIQFRLILLVVGASFLVWFIVRLNCSVYVPVWVLAVYDGQFPAQFLVSWQQYHVTYGKDIPSFPGVVLFFSVPPVWMNLTAAGGACTWHCGDNFL